MLRIIAAISVLLLSQSVSAAELWCKPIRTSVCNENGCQTNENSNTNISLKIDLNQRIYKRCNGAGDDCNSYQVTPENMSPTIGMGFWRTMHIGTSGGAFVKVFDAEKKLGTKADYIESISSKSNVYVYHGACE